MSPSVTTVSVRNGGRSKVFLDVQLRGFLDFARSLVAARMRTSVIERRIFLPSLAKARLMSINTTVGDSRDPARAKAVTIFHKGTCF